jgi:GTP 3',8-cyclase
MTPLMLGRWFSLLDLFNRDITYLRVSVTDRCNFRCQYCMDEDGVDALAHDDILSFEELYTIIQRFVELGVNKVRLTGGEPLVRKGIVNFIASLARLHGIKDLAMTTNGSLLNEYALPLKNAGLKRINVSLDTLNPNKFTTITRGGQLQPVLDGIALARSLGLIVKINVVLMKGINDDEVGDFIQLTKQGIDVRFIELMPLGDTTNFAKHHFLNYETILNQYALQQVASDDPHSPAKYYRYQNNTGKVGFITALSNHFCGACNRMRLTADGKLRPCLLQETEIDIKALLRSGKPITPTLKQVITNKPQQHQLNDDITAQRAMNKIGG